MTEGERKLRTTIARLHDKVHNLEEEIERLWTANGELVLERNATDELLGAAIDILRKRFGEDW